MKNLLFILLSFVLLSASKLQAKPLTLKEATEASCRVTSIDEFSYTRGSGTVVNEDDKKYYILTNAHVVDQSNGVWVEFFKDAKKSFFIPAKIELIRYQNNTSIDLAIISVKKTLLGKQSPRVIPLASKEFKINEGDYIFGAGYPSGNWAMCWEGRINDVMRNTVTFNALPSPGQSGTGVLANIPDEKGELHTKVVTLLTWRIDQGLTGYGAGLSNFRIQSLLEGNVEPDAIESSYKTTQLISDPIRPISPLKESQQKDILEAIDELSKGAILLNKENGDLKKKNKYLEEKTIDQGIIIDEFESQKRNAKTSTLWKDILMLATGAVTGALAYFTILTLYQRRRDDVS